MRSCSARPAPGWPDSPARLTETLVCPAAQASGKPRASAPSTCGPSCARTWATLVRPEHRRSWLLVAFVKVAPFEQPFELFSMVYYESRFWG